MPFPLYIKHFQHQKHEGIAKKLEIHYTPKHGSWLNIAEIKLNVMTRQCLSRRVEENRDVPSGTGSMGKRPQSKYSLYPMAVHHGKARTKLVSLYPKFGLVEDE